VGAAQLAILVPIVMNKRKKATTLGATRRARTARPVNPSANGSHTARGVFAIAAECTVADADSLKSGLAKLLEDSGPVTLDISAVQRIDTAGLQVIAAFVRECESYGRRVEWQGAAPAFTAAVVLLGLGACLRLPAQVAGDGPSGTHS
jgi:anti-anti-sigma regulatory factor